MSPLDPSPAPLTPARFATLFRETSGVLWCVAVGVVGDRDLGEDILQEAALLALGKLDTFRPGTSFGAWMGQFVRYLALNQRRKRERRRRALDAEGPVPISTASQPLGPHSLFDRNVARALAELSEAQRTCLLLKTIVELEYAEIGALLDIPPGTAMSHVSRGRAKMRRLLEAEPELPTKEALP